ncbi:ribonuclease H-like domain-containing protein [Mycena rebaudengoi]|nr:ribonuclease H-like domain-containing protein [Mycena rebaudengoi]
MTRYTLRAWVDGACLRNGLPGAVGGAGACFPCAVNRNTGCFATFKRKLPLESDAAPRPTNQRAELVAIILALQVACRLEMNWGGPIFLIIHSDSKYAVESLDQFVYEYLRNGWTTSAGLPAKNRDLIELAHGLRREIEKRSGVVAFKWIPRGENKLADFLAKEACNLTSVSNDLNIDGIGSIHGSSSVISDHAYPAQYLF